MNTFINNLNWRYAVKKFDKNKKLKTEDLEAIIEATRLAPTSFGLQPFHIYVVSDQKLKKKMKLHSFLQPQVEDCNTILVFCTDSDVKNKIDQYTSKTVENSNIIDKVKLKATQARMLAWLGGMSKDQLSAWATNQTYIALGFALAACAELKVDSCPMEGFLSKPINKILGVPENHNSVVYLALGHRLEKPERKKIRLDKNDLFTYK